MGLLSLGANMISSDSLVIAGRTFSSRLIVGTGKYSSPSVMVRAHDASGADMITVAVRRVNISDRSKESLLDHIDTSRYFLLPNTAGCYTADEAIRTARLGREAGPFQLGEARGDRRRADVVSGQRGAARGDARAGSRRIRGAALHDRRSRCVPEARRGRRRGGHAAWRTDRLRARHPEPQQPSDHPRIHRGFRSSSTPESAPPRTQRSRWRSAPTAC